MTDTIACVHQELRPSSNGVSSNAKGARQKIFKLLSFGVGTCTQDTKGHWLHWKVVLTYLLLAYQLFQTPDTVPSTQMIGNLA